MMDSDVLPEGLHVELGERLGELQIKDAQEHVWVTLHDKAEGDPLAWPLTILNCVLSALEIDDNRGW